MRSPRERVKSKRRKRAQDCAPASKEPAEEGEPRKDTEEDGYLQGELRGSRWFQKEGVGFYGKPPHPHPYSRYQSSLGRQGATYTHSHTHTTQHMPRRGCCRKCHSGFDQGWLGSFKQKEVVGELYFFWS